MGIMTTQPDFTAKKCRTVCVIVAGGSGTRCGADGPKQFQQLGGEAVLCHSVRFFGNHPAIDEVVVVAPADALQEAAMALAAIDFPAPLTIVAGGPRRQDSVRFGVIAAGECDLVAIHDGARPFPPANFDEGIAAALDAGAAIFAMPSTDSIKLVEHQAVVRTVPRENLWAVQTPQIFRPLELIEALETCERDKLEITDDASAYEHLGRPVRVVPGSRRNLKITYAEDFIMAEALLKGKV